MARILKSSSVARGDCFNANPASIDLNEQVVLKRWLLADVVGSSFPSFDLDSIGHFQALSLGGGD